MTKIYYIPVIGASAHPIRKIYYLMQADSKHLSFYQVQHDENISYKAHLKEEFYRQFHLELTVGKVFYTASQGDDLYIYFHAVILGWRENWREYVFPTGWEWREGTEIAYSNYVMRPIDKTAINIALKETGYIDS